MILRIVLAVFVIVSAVSAIWAQDPPTVVLVTHDSFAISEATVTAFENESGMTLEILRAGDAGQMVNQAILTKNNPLGDVLFGIDNTFLSRALSADIFEPYESSRLQYVAAEFIPDDTNRVTPVDFGDVCLNFDIGYFAENEVALPTSLLELTQSEYASLLVVENPATSSPGLAFLLATIAQFGTEGEYTFLNYWEDLRRNDVLVVDGWTEAYYGEFSAPGRDTGTRPLVVSYASSPPAEVLFSESPDEGPFTGALTSENMCFRQIEYAGILANASNPEGARLLVDFMLSVTFQEDIPLNMFVFPVVENIELPSLFQELAQIPEMPASLDYDSIEANREAWIQAWSEVMLR